MAIITVDAEIDMSDIKTDDLLNELEKRHNLVQKVLDILDDDDLRQMYLGIKDRIEISDEMPSESLEDQMKSEIVLAVWDDMPAHEFERRLKK